MCRTSFVRVFSVVALILTLASCGQPPSNTAQTSYISWGSSSVAASTIADLRKSTVNICLKGSVSPADFERSKAWALRATLSWMRVVKLIDEKVTNSVAFSCTNTDLTINLRNGSGTSFASPSVATIYMTRPYGTWTHELGHALAGLSDTYAGGAGTCKSGQPQSLMCWGAYGPRANPDSFSTLWADDIAGIRANYKLVFGGSNSAPTWADQVNPEAPLNSQEPWPMQSGLAVAFEDSNVEIITDALATEIIFNDPHSIDL